MTTQQNDLSVTVRPETGKGGNRKLRQTGLIPGVIYGKKKENINVSFNPELLRRALVKGGGQNALIQLVEENSKSFGKKTVMVKDIQRDPITTYYLHADFYELDLTQKVTVEVALHFVGKAEGLKKGAIVQPVIREVEVRCLPNKIPTHIEVDVSALDVGDALHLEDIPKSPDYEVLFEQNDTIVTVNIPKEEVAPTPQAAPAEGEAAAEPEVQGKGKEAKPAEGAPAKAEAKPGDAKKAAPDKKEGK